MNATYYPNETNSLGQNGNDYHKQFFKARLVPWTATGLKVTRFRILTDPGFPYWDVSYCHGEITHPDGSKENVRVELPFSQLPRRGMTKFIIDHARKDKVYAKGLGILDAISSLW